MAGRACTKCDEVKPLDDFYKHPTSRDGYDTKCKECAKAAARKNRDDNLERAKRYDRMRAFSDERVAMRKAYQERKKSDPAFKAKQARRKKVWQAEHAGKRTAHNAVNNAVRDNRLGKLPCECCGATENVHAHHDDYNYPLDVVWLCTKHHGERHRVLNAFCGGTIDVREKAAA